MIITFIGHSSVVCCDKLREELRAQIRVNADGQERLVCYLGGYGNFDSLSAEVCRELKKEYPHIEVVYVTPYLNHDRLDGIQKSGIYDLSIYPPLENVPLRFTKQNISELLRAHRVVRICFLLRFYL